MTTVHDIKHETQLVRALRRHQETGDRKAMALDCYQLGILYQERGQVEAAVQSVRRALVLCEALRDVRGVAMSYCRLGLLQEILGDYGQAAFLLEEARARHEQIHDLRGLADDLGYIGFIQFQQADYPAAETNYREALTLHQQLRNVGKQAEDWGNLGNLQVTRGDGEQAIESHHKSLRLYEEAGDRQGMGHQYRALARLAMDSQEPERALDLLQAALTMHRDAGDALGEGLTHEVLGIVHEREARREEAEASFLQGIELVAPSGHKRNLSSLTGRLGSLRLRRGDVDGAMVMLEQALTMARDVADQTAEARWGKRLADGEMKRDQADLGRVFQLYQQSLARYQVCRDAEGVAQVYVGLGNLAARRGESTQAVAMWTAATERFRSLGREAQVRQVEGAIQNVWMRGHREVA